MEGEEGWRGEEVLTWSRQSWSWVRQSVIFFFLDGCLGCVWWWGWEDVECEFGVFF